ncbi:zinc-ribbon domain containing protein, partial [Haloferula sp. A504]|uniref:zinc-ribbon domain containing protein n=1 Tax=Haloferula sp. A504 TaxID=3373601 RepID=UPI0031C4EA30|nr:BET domain-containing protein [Verrucomicrobiaceae bacterium E54]
ARPSEEPGAVVPHAGICEGGAGRPASLPQSAKKMTFADKKNIKLRLRLLNEQRLTRIRKLIERGLIESEKDVPEHAIPVDLDSSSLADLILPPAYYEDIEYDCVECGTHETWRAETQQYYFEVLKASPYSQAVRCPNCQATRKRSIQQNQQNKP